jgi:hypothetical protein
MAKSHRTSDYLTAVHVDGIHLAIEHAELIGQPLNAFLTVHWGKWSSPIEKLGPFEVTTQRRQGRLLICIRHWLVRRGARLTCVWALEAQHVGVHSHILIHIPRRKLAAFTREIPRWLGVGVLPRDQWRQFNSKTYTQAVGEDGIWRLDRIYNLVGLERYILKGAQGARLGGGIKYVPQGRIVGKRCGFSNNIGPAARERWIDRTAA